MGKRHVLYFNGLGPGKTRRRERRAIAYLARRDIQVEHVGIDWYSAESFEALLERVTKLTKDRIKQHGELILVGSSAGGSLAVNVMSRLHDRRLYAVTLCSRLQEATLPAWDRRTLELVSHIGTDKESRKFFDSVTYCTSVAAPKLTKADKHRIITVQQLADFVVPRQTMPIKGVRIYKVPGLGHAWGIAMGARRLPEIIQLFAKE